MSCLEVLLYLMLLYIKVRLYCYLGYHSLLNPSSWFPFLGSQSPVLGSYGGDISETAHAV